MDKTLCDKCGSYYYGCGAHKEEECEKEQKLKNQGRIIGVISGIILFSIIFWKIQGDIGDLTTPNLLALFVGIFGGTLIGVYYVALCRD